MILIVDANVLIDYAKSDLNVLTLVSKSIGQIYVPSVVLSEVQQLDEKKCKALDLVVLEEPVDILLDAAEKRGGLSFQDHVCLLLAKANDWVCVTNDRSLYKACESDQVQVKRGLRMMIDLVELGCLEKDSAINIVQKIHLSNPRNICLPIVEEFKKIITDIIN